MPEGWNFLLALSAGILIAGITALFLWRPGLDLWSDAFIKRLMKDPYTENIGEMYNVFRKVGVQNVLESDLRATSGEPLQRPFGTPRHFSPWDKLLFNPVYFSRKPTVDSVNIDTKVVLGPQAKRPLYLEMPLTIAGMAYGAGPSLQAKIALAKGADLVNTATTTGAGPFLPEERKHTKRLIIQYNRGWWAKEEAMLRTANAIEIQLGYGAYGSAPVVWKYQDMSPEFRDYLHLKPGQDLTQESMLPNAKNSQELKSLVDYLRALTNGAPIGIKFGATHFLEDELKIFMDAGIDFVSIAGNEAGIHYGPAILADDLGLPTLPALCRTVAFLKQAGLKDKVSIIISGGLCTPGQMLKALALGADAVAIGTIALLALAHTQITKVLPWEPLTQLVYENGKSRNKLQIDPSAISIANFLKSCDAEIKLAIRTLGWSSLKQVSSADLCALSEEVAKITGAELGFFPPSKKGGPTMNRSFWILLAGAMTGIFLGLWMIHVCGRAMIWRLKSWKTVAVEMMTILKKITWRNYLESMLRTEEGKAIPRPFGTSIHFFDWKQFQFNPAYISRKPLAPEIPIQTEVILGPLAKKPLKLSNPIMIAGMSYGSSLSFKAKIALAKAATLIGINASTGSGPFIEEIGALAEKNILQLSRGYWSRSEDILRRVDMIEISLGHGAWGPAPVRISGKEVINGFAKRIGSIPGLDVILESRLPEVESQRDWKALINRLKEISDGIPIAVKIGGTHYLERELELLLEGGVDVLVLDGAEGGTHACPVILLDDVGLPTLPCLCRAAKFFEKNQLKGKVSLVISGGLVTPGDFLKSLALGADAIAIGTIATLVMSHTQVTKSTPWEPPTQIIYYGAKKEAAYNPELGAKHLANFFASCIEEIKLAAHSLGKADLREINKSDLVALDPLYAEMAGVQYVEDPLRTNLKG